MVMVEPNCDTKVLGEVVHEVGESRIPTGKLERLGIKRHGMSLAIHH